MLRSSATRITAPHGPSVFGAARRAEPRPATSLSHAVRSSYLAVLTFKRPVVSSELMILMSSIAFSVLFNKSFWSSAVPSPWVQWKLSLSLFLILTALHCLLLGIIVNRWIVKPVLTVLLIATALAAHFMSAYGIYLDADMLRNVLNTDTKESEELMTISLLVPVALALFPVALLWWTQIKRRSIARASLVRLAFLATSVLVILVGVSLSSRDVSSLLRNQREIRYLVTPANYLVALSKVLLAAPPGKKASPLPIGEDAVQKPSSAARKPRLVVLVVGETVRAKNWELNGYARQTTPRLSTIPGLVNFSNSVACGSSTEVSLPCMFSPYGRSNYDQKRIRSHQSLLHVLNRGGVQTLWIDNQSGCKGVCAGLPYLHVGDDQDTVLCNGTRCHDEILVKALASHIIPARGDRLVVLHQLGNHGPNYFERYPDRFKRFMPPCESPDLGKCTVGSIVNAYDNAALYTDHILAETISLLEGQSHYDAAMIYVSDHGESLGENGLFLHGIPYAIAPDEQLEVPMVIWLSAAFSITADIDMDCLKSVANKPVSHDNLFSSILGLLDVETTLYIPNLDVFYSCRTRRD
ncbi:phosphoethanolamine--lipid A transferase [Pseudoxanthomonas sp. CF125]|uniref:phosphoethanolamine transferase n=1 Tax=Pseudoxanthomonas sp. CF125 TaxID=1855303 RepID=UPI000B86D958|nr:phosphoethanolamine--lipid A transferase [Pseudoxanthomonas sp. CF125]